MTLREITGALELEVACGADLLERDVEGGYVGDLLSDVLAHSDAGQVWITMQAHVNIVAVAVLKELAAIILVNGRSPADDTVKKALEEHVPILLSAETAFAVAGRLHRLTVPSTA